MLKRKVQALKMLVAVQRFFQMNQAVLEQWTALKAAIFQFNARMKTLSNAVELSDTLTTTVTAGKQELKRILAYELALIAAQAHSHAILANIQDLKVATDFSESQLAAMSDKKLKTTAGQLIKTVEARNGELGEYKIEDPAMNNAKLLLDAFSTDSEAPRNAIAGKSSSLTFSNKEIRFLQVFLEESLDRLIAKIRTTHPEVHGEYFKNREIVDAGSRETRITGLVTGPDGKPLSKAIVTAEETETGVRFESTSDSNGGFLISVKEAGNYKVSFAHSLYGTVSAGIIKVGIGDQPRVSQQMKAA